MLRLWKTFSAAPHRVMFLGGAIQSLLTLSWWMLDLAGRYGGLYAPLPWPLPPAWIHAFLMIYGFFPFFIFGFAMTALRHWVGSPPVPLQWYIPAFLPLILGNLLFYVGLWLPWLLQLALALIVIGWGIGVYSLVRVLRSGSDPDQRHALVLAIALGFGWLGVLGYWLWLLTGAEVLMAYARHAGIWWFLLPIFVAVSHRMIPYFSKAVLKDYMMFRPYWMLWVLLACLAVHGTLEFMDLRAWLWIADLPIAVLALYLSAVWGFRRSFQGGGLLAVLHLGFLWLGIAALLYVIQSATQFTTGITVLGLAPLHALTLGYFGTTVLGMATRVTLGHSGRPLVADRTTEWLFLGFQAAVLLRIIGDIGTGWPLAIWHPYWLAGLIWLACFGIWFGKYAPLYWRPRADGRPG
jgi:uncharacterized protein involved in response to NO